MKGVSVQGHPMFGGSSQPSERLRREKAPSASQEQLRRECEELRSEMAIREARHQVEEVSL